MVAMNLAKFYEPQGGKDITIKPVHKLIKSPTDPTMAPGRFFADGYNVMKYAKDAGLGRYPDDEAAKDADGRRLAGRPHAGLGALIDYFNASKNCPIYNMQMIHEVGWTFSYLQPGQVSQLFGSEIDLFGDGRAPAGIQYVQTTMPQTGETNAAFVACAVLLHCEPEPFCWTAQGNVWSAPLVGSAPPISPNDWTTLDRTNAVFGAAVAAGTQVFLKAVLEWGWPMNYAFWHLVRGYNLRWTQGRHTNIFDDLARYTAYMPPNAQEGSASSSEQDILDFVRRVNAYYLSQGSPLVFLKANRIRTGFIDTLNGSVPISTFRVSRDLQKVGVTYGGSDLRSMLRGNSEYRKLAVPYMIDPGVPIGMILDQSDPVEAALMQRELDLTQSFGGAAFGTTVIPPQLVDSANINIGADGGALPQGAELSLDAVQTLRAMQSDTSQVLIKGGEGKLRLGVVGFELTKDQWLAMNADAELRDAVQRDCGICFCG
jgi:hypothetical protein